MSREMKDSGIPWIGEIPKDWGNLKFKYSGSFQKGKLPKEFNVEGNGYPIIGASEMLGKTPRLYSLEADLPVCDIEDILILWDGANAGIVSTNHKGIISSTTVRYSCADKRCSSGYVFYLFKSVEPYFREKVFGTTIPHMNMEYINDVPLLLPTLAEQKAIADFLDRKCGEIDELISLQERMIEELKAYKQSVITEAVTKGLNPNVPLKDSGIEWIGQIPEHWRVSKIKNENNILDYLRQPISAEKRINELGLYDYYGASGVIDKIDEYNVNDKVLLIGEDGAHLTLRNLPLIYKACGKFWVNNHAHILKVNSSNDYEYMFYMLEAGDYFHYITGSAQPKLSQENLKNFVIPIPPLSEQQEIADYLDKKCSEIDRLVALKQTKIEELKDYKKSFIYEYVTGKKGIGNQ